MTNLVTIVNRAYLPGFLTLLQSLSEKASLPADTRFLCLYDEEDLLDDLRRCEVFGIPLDFIPLAEMGEIKSPWPQKTQNLEYAYRKLLVLKAPASGTLAYLDTDMLCVGSLNDIHEMHHFTAAREVHREPHKNPDNTPMFNTGFFVFQPSLDLFQSVMNFCAESPAGYDLADQGVLNAFFHQREPGQIHLLPCEWNWLTADAGKRCPRGLTSEVRLVHFIGNKPWEKTVRESLGGRTGFLEARWWDTCFRANERVTLKTTERIRKPRPWFLWRALFRSRRACVDQLSRLRYSVMK